MTGWGLPAVLVLLCPGMRKKEAVPDQHGIGALRRAYCHHVTSTHVT